MTLGCIIIAHRAPAQVRLLLQAMSHPRVRLYLHVDSRVPSGPFAVEGVTLLRQRATVWGGPEIIDALLDGLTHALRDGCDYVMLLTGQGFLLKPIHEILAFFEGAPTRSYSEYRPLADPRRTDFFAYTVRGRRELCIPWGQDTSMLRYKGKALNWMLRVRNLPKGRRSFPDYLQPFAGRVWWDLSTTAANHVLSFAAEHPDYRRYHEHTWCPDEIFFCSILAQSGLEIENRSMRYYTWGDGARSLTASPSEIPAMLDSGALFAQKVDGGTASELSKRFGLPEAQPFARQSLEDR